MARWARPEPLVAPAVPVRAHGLPERCDRELRGHQALAQDPAAVHSPTEEALKLAFRGGTACRIEPAVDQKVAQAKDLVQLLEREFGRFERPDEQQALDIGLGIEAETAVSPPGRRDEAHLLVVPDRPQRESRSARDLADLVGVVALHRVIVAPNRRARRGRAESADPPAAPARQRTSRQGFRATGI